MARFYGSIDKETFLKKVKGLFDTFEEEYSFSGKIDKDLEKVSFDFENKTFFEHDICFSDGKTDYIVGYKDLSNNSIPFHCFFVNAGGDWETPIVFVLYYSGKEMRAYIPSAGNPWNKKTKAAFGNEDDFESEELEENEETKVLPEYYNEELLIADILERIKPSPTIK